LFVPGATKTRYASASGVEIAYQVVGDGSTDLLLYTGAAVPIDCMDDEPSMARFQRRLASFGRLLRFDTRGTGLSDRSSRSTPPTPEQWVEDGVAVLDAVGSENAAVLAPWAHSQEGLMLAAAHNQRVAKLVIINGRARSMWAPDYPWGYPERSLDMGQQMVINPDAVEQGFDLLGLIAPSVAADQSFRDWWDRSGNLGANPAMAREKLRVLYETDVRDQLALIRAPTLIIHRRDSFLPPGNGRYLAEHISGAKYVELPGPDLMYWVGETGPMLDEIEEFVTGVRGGLGSERVLATVLFTDIVGSTERAALLGDRRWRDLLDRHDQNVRIQIQRFQGREVNTVGDGFVATFDSPSRAIACALAIRDTLKASEIDIRAGVHTGEIEVRGDDVAGLAVHIGARVSAMARPGEVLISGAVPPLLAGSDIKFEDRGDHELKGVPGTWRLFAVEV
jgi:class 3 adenylate cyclase